MGRLERLRYVTVMLFLNPAPRPHSPMTTNVVVVVVVVIVVLVLGVVDTCCYEIFEALRHFHFTTDRHFA